MSQYEGGINQIYIREGKMRILGWLWDRESPDSKCQAVLKIEDITLITIRCDRYREDLRQHHIGNGEYAFQVELKHTLPPEKALQLKLHPIDKDKQTLAAVSHAPPDLIIEQDSPSQSSEPESQESLEPLIDLSEKIDADLKRIAERGGAREDALEYLMQQLETNPSNHSLHHKIGDYYRDLAQYEPALTWYQNAIDLNAKALWSYHNMSVALAGLNRWDESLEMIESISRIDPAFWQETRENFLVNFHKANHLEYQNQTSQAIEAYTLAFQLNPKSHTCLYRLINLVWKTHQLVDVFVLINRLQPEEAILEKMIVTGLNQKEKKGLSREKLYSFLLLIMPDNYKLHKALQEKEWDGCCNNHLQQVKNIEVRRYSNLLKGFDFFLDEMDEQLNDLKQRSERDFLF